MGHDPSRGKQITMEKMRFPRGNNDVPNSADERQNADDAKERPPQGLRGDQDEERGAAISR